MRRTGLIAAMVILLPLTAAAITGDCNGDGIVEVSEVVRGVRIALGVSPLDDCGAFDANGDGVIDVGELVAGISLSLSAEPTPTATGGASPTPAESFTATPTVTDTVEPGATPTSTPTIDESASPTASPTVTPTGQATATSSATATSNPSSSSTPTATLPPGATATSTATLTTTAQATSTATGTATRTATATSSLTATPTGTATATPTRTSTSTPTRTSTSTSTPTATETVPASPTPTLPRFFVLDFGSAGTGGIPCFDTQIPFQLLGGANNVHEMTIDFCTDAASFDVTNATCQAQNVAVMVEQAANQLACDLADPVDPRGQVRVTVRSNGPMAIPVGELLLTCGLPVLPTTLTGIYDVDYSIRGLTTGDQAFVDFGASTISISADDQFEGQCCGADAQCSSGFCRGGYVPEQNSVCCESDCAGGVCNHPSSPGTCFEFPGGEFHVSTISYRSQYRPDVAALDDGFVVAWSGNAFDLYNGRDVFARRFDGFGVGANEVTANQTLIGNQRSASVAATGPGFVVAWRDLYGVYARRFDSQGSPVGSQFQADTVPTSYQYDPPTSAGGAPGGGFAIVWDDYGQDGFGLGVFGRRYDSNGDSIGEQFLVNAYTSGSEGEPAIAFGPNGTFVVAWSAVGRGVVGQRFDSAGGRVGSEFVAPDLFSAPGIAVAADGTFVVAGNDFDGSYFGGVFAQRFASSGAPLGGRFQVNTYTVNAAERAPDVAFGTDSTFVIVWEGGGQDGYNYGIFGQRFSSNGAPVGTEFQVNSYTASNEVQPAVAGGDGANGFVVVWQGNGGYSLPGILGQRLP